MVAQSHEPGARAYTFDVQIKLELAVLVFVEGGKPENQEKHPRSRERTKKTNSTHMKRRVRESNPGHRRGSRGHFYGGTRVFV